jgi:hypothetical protein
MAGNVKARPDTAIIWINYSEEPVEIIFSGQGIQALCAEPVRFFEREDGAYMSERMSYGSVASLCFADGGSFDYFVRSVTEHGLSGGTDTEQVHRGRIVVE